MLFSSFQPSTIWSGRWVDQEPFLLMQHRKIESCLDELLNLYGFQSIHWKDVEYRAYDYLCRRLVWDLSLHQRLEVRWLKMHNALSHGHESDHNQVIQEAILDCRKTITNKNRRFAWLRELRSWFVGHENSSDAFDYSLARSL